MIDIFSYQSYFRYLLLLLLILIIVILLIYYYYNHTYLSVDQSIFKNMKQYYINLERSKDRNENIYKILSGQDLYPERYGAIDGKKL